MRQMAKDFHEAMQELFLACLLLDKRHIRTYTKGGDIDQ
jgi:hypothetical protein